MHEALLSNAFRVDLALAAIMLQGALAVPKAESRDRGLIEGLLISESTNCQGFVRRQAASRWGGMEPAWGALPAQD